MSESTLPAKDRPVSKPGKETGHPVLRLVTGLFDDVRQELVADKREQIDRVYGVFLDAYHQQLDWSDREHRDFWATHLAMWPGEKGSSNSEALAFIVHTARWQGFTDDELLEAMPGRSRDDFRRRGILKLADEMECWHRGVHASHEPMDVAATPRLAADGGTVWPGPADPAVVRAGRLQRLPLIVRVDVAAAAGEPMPLPPGCGHVNLPLGTGRMGALAVKSVGEASLAAIDEGMAALARLHDTRAQRDPPGTDVE